eukprot:gene18649-25165_t
MDSQAPNVDTQPPHVDTQAPHMDSQPPLVNTQAPHMDSQLPHEDTQAPHMDSQRPHAGSQVRKMIGPLFQMFPAPNALAAAEGPDVQQLESLLQPLGLFRKRARMLVQFSKEYIEKEESSFASSVSKEYLEKEMRKQVGKTGTGSDWWTHPDELHGIGKYAADAYQLFCRGEWQQVQPEDKDLKQYLRWLEGTDGFGSGLERESLASVLGDPTPPSSSDQVGCIETQTVGSRQYPGSTSQRKRYKVNVKTQPKGVAPKDVELPTPTVVKRQRIGSTSQRKRSKVNVEAQPKGVAPTDFELPTPTVVKRQRTGRSGQRKTSQVDVETHSKGLAPTDFELLSPSLVHSSTPSGACEEAAPPQSSSPRFMGSKSDRTLGALLRKDAPTDFELLSPPNIEHSLTPDSACEEAAPPLSSPHFTGVQSEANQRISSKSVWMPQKLQAVRLLLRRKPGRLPESQPGTTLGLREPPGGSSRDNKFETSMSRRLEALFGPGEALQGTAIEEGALVNEARRPVAMWDLHPFSITSTHKRIPTSPFSMSLTADAISTASAKSQCSYS